jgi:hypothetical protein
MFLNARCSSDCRRAAIKTPEEIARAKISFATSVKSALKNYRKYHLLRSNSGSLAIFSLRSAARLILAE